MSKKITVCLFNQYHARVRFLSVSKNRIVGLMGILAFGCILIAFFFIDYVNLATSQGFASHVRHKMALQQEEILRQRSRIKNFANEINKLKSSLMTYHQFEKKIRLISDIEAEPASSSLFGIGGPAPDDIDVNVHDHESHDELLREMHTQLKQVDEAAVTQRQGLLSLLNYLEEQRNLLSSTPSIRPADGWISSGFGYRQSPFTGVREFHKGVDIAASDGQSVYASGDGQVIFAGSKGAMGKMIVIDHGHGMTTRYGHLKKLSKNQGDRLKRGEVIGFIGTSGRTTGPHLHYEVLVNSIQVKPQEYMLD